jgi:hypothetical protein
MRKSLWMIPVVLLAMAIGSTSANADSYTIVESGGAVTAIDNLAILGNTYDVTFVETVTPTITFTSESDAVTAATDINNALNGITSVPYTILGGVYVSVPFSTTDWVESFCGSGSCTGPTWTIAGDITRSGTQLPITFAEFTVVTPEPGTLSLMLVGVGLLGLMMVGDATRAAKASRTNRSLSHPAPH